MKNRLKKFIGEMIPVVVGILIALVINNWQENANDRQFVNKVFTSIANEFEENKLELQNSIQEHEMLLDTINFYLDDDDVRLGDIIQKNEGLRVVAIKNTAWKSFLNEKMELIEYEQVSVLSNIDAMKEAMQTQVEKMIDFIYLNSATTDFNKKLIFQMIIGDLLHSEQTILKDHEAFLKINAE